MQTFTPQRPSAQRKIKAARQREAIRAGLITARDVAGLLVFAALGYVVLVGLTV